MARTKQNARKTPKYTTATSADEEGGGGDFSEPLVWPRSRKDLTKDKFLKVFKKKGLPKSLADFRIPQTEAPFQCTLALPSVLPNQEFVGEPSSNRNAAELSALMVLSRDEAALRSISALGPREAVMERTGVESFATAKGSLHQLLQKKGYPISSAVYTTSCADGAFWCRLNVECIRPGLVFEGGPCSSQKEAERAAAYAFLTNKSSSNALEEDNISETPSESADSDDDESTDNRGEAKRRKIEVKLESVCV